VSELFWAEKTCQKTCQNCFVNLARAKELVAEKNSSDTFSTRAKADVGDSVCVRLLDYYLLLAGGGPP
jgi:hypothetical protein